MKLIIDILEEVVTAIQNGEDYRYDIHTAIAQGIPYEERSKSELIEIKHRLNLLIGVLYSNQLISECDLEYIEDSIKKLMKGGAE